MLGILRRSRAGADVCIEVPPVDFEVALVRVRRFLLWSWTRVVRRRIRIVALPLRDLLAAHDRLRRLGNEMDGLNAREALFVATQSKVVLRLTDERAAAIWSAWQDANRVTLGRRGGAAGGGHDALDLVFQLQRWPFNFSEDQVLSMSAAEAVSRLAEWQATQRRGRAADA